MTKKEMKELEAAQNVMRSNRYKFVNELNSFWRDVHAAEVYLKTKGEKVTKEEKERLFRQYESLNEYNYEYDKSDVENYRIWDAFRCIVNSSGDKAYEVSKELNISLDRDDAFYDEIIWDTNHLTCILRELRKYGFKRLFYIDNSTAAMRNISDMIMLGATIEGQVVNLKYNNYGIIINIENVNLEEKFMEDSDIEYIVDTLSTLGKSIKWDFECKDVINKIYKKFSTKYDFIDINNQVELIKHNLIKSMED